MEDKTIDGVTVKTEQISLHPLAYKIRAEHSEGTTHESTLTIGDADLANIVTLEQAQAHLDNARNKAVEMCQKKAALAAIASKLQ